MNRLPSHILKRESQVMQIGFIAAFTLLFILIYHPLDLEDMSVTMLQNLGWNRSLIAFTLTATVIIVGLGVTAISRTIMIAYTKKHEISIVGYVVWILAEVIIMASVYTMGSYVNDSSQALEELFRKSLYKTVLVILIPYLISYVVIIWREQARSLNDIRRELENGRESSVPYIQILDERGDLRLSIKRENLLFIEAEDNYVNVCYLAGENIKNVMVRNSLKKIAEQLDSEKIVRCHRSYLVNLDHVKVLRREKDCFYIEMGIDKVPDIPISKTYGETVTNKIMRL